MASRSTRHNLGVAPHAWWRRKAPRTARACYSRKTDALNAFKDQNLDIVERWGMNRSASGGEFDAVNERYNLRGKKRVKTLAQALWAVMPGRPPYCLDKIDLATLNETTPAREGGGFRLPDEAAAERWKKGEERYWRSWQERKDRSFDLFGSRKARRP